MNTINTINTITLSAFAKLNLGLDVVGRRADGYHLLETVFQMIDMHDTVTVSLNDTGKITLTCDNPDVPCGERNIAFRSAAAFLQAAELSLGADIHIEKRIPMEAGLGGGSTDAAAVLTGLGQLTDALDEKTMGAIAAELGADVPFLLDGGTAYAEGIGEKLEVLPTLSGGNIVVAKGCAGVSTAAAYREIDALPGDTSHPPVQALREAIRSGAGIEAIAPWCGNLFEAAVHLPEVDAIKGVMTDCGSLCAVLTGSGAAVFGIFAERERARRCVQVLGERGMFAQVCRMV